MTKNNRERQAEFKRRMRDAGKKQITVWVTPAQEETIRTLLNQEEAGNTEETQDSVPVKSAHLKKGEASR